MEPSDTLTCPSPICRSQTPTGRAAGQAPVSWELAFPGLPPADMTWRHPRRGVGTRLSSVPAGPSVQTGLSEGGRAWPASPAGRRPLPGRCPQLQGAPTDWGAASCRGWYHKPPTGSAQYPGSSAAGPHQNPSHGPSPPPGPQVSAACSPESGGVRPLHSFSQTQPDLSWSPHAQIPPPPNAITPAGRLLLCSSFARTSPAGSMLTVCMVRTLASALRSCGPRWPYTSCPYARGHSSSRPHQLG